MKLLIVQWTQHEESDFSDRKKDRNSCLEKILAVADEQRFDLYVGLSLRRSWWRAESFTRKYASEELARNTTLADRLHPILKKHPSFRGWYVPHEVTDIDNGGEEQNAVVKFFAALTRHLHTLDSLKPVLAAAYSDPAKTKLVHFVSWWTIFIRESGVDIFLFQDGAGLKRQHDWRQGLSLIEALGALHDEFASELWLVPELFTQVHGEPVDSKPFEAHPADVGRVREQLEALAKHNRRLIGYSYFDYMDPDEGEPATRLYEAMRKHVEERAAVARTKVITSTRPATWPSAR